MEENDDKSSIVGGFSQKSQTHLTMSAPLSRWARATGLGCSGMSSESVSSSRSFQLSCKDPHSMVAPWRLETPESWVNSAGFSFSFGWI